MNIDQTGSTDFLNFSEALHHLRWGDKIARRIWSTGQYVQATYTMGDTALRVVGGPRFERGKLTGTEIMAEDWYVV